VAVAVRSWSAVCVLRVQLRVLAVTPVERAGAGLTGWPVRSGAVCFDIDLIGIAT
jgi:hypothetical protein